MEKKKPKLAKVVWKAKAKTVDYQAGYQAGIKAGTAKEREACAAMLDDEADKQEREWNEYLASGKHGPATSLHGIPRGYADAIRKRSNAKLTG